MVKGNKTCKADLYFVFFFFGVICRVELYHNSPFLPIGRIEWKKYLGRKNNERVY